MSENHENLSDIATLSLNSRDFRKETASRIMNEAYLTEIFPSIQGEGPWMGFLHLFVRFAGCDLRCQWCDTPNSLRRNKSSRFTLQTKTLISSADEKVSLDNPVSIQSLREVISDVLKCNAVQAISFTGGEPLLQADFLKEFLEVIRFDKAFEGVAFYLETGGHRYKELPLVIQLLDFVSFDLKLSSSTAEKVLWEEHRLFLEQLGSKEAYAKIVVSSSTEVQEIREACRLLRQSNVKELVLQPVTATANLPKSIEPGMKLLLQMQEIALSELKSKKVRILPQLHKLLQLP